MESLKNEYTKNLDVKTENESSEAATHHKNWEDWRVRQQQDMAAIAEVRGREAARKHRGQVFVEEKAKQATKETKMGAKLVEKLRAAEVVSRPMPARIRGIEIIDVAGGKQVQIQDKRQANNKTAGIIDRIPLGELGNKWKAAMQSSSEVIWEMEEDHQAELNRLTRMQSSSEVMREDDHQAELNRLTRRQPSLEVIREREEDHQAEWDRFAVEREEAALRQESLTREFNRMMLELDNVPQTKLSDSSLSQLSGRSLSPAYLSTIFEATEDNTGMVSDDTTAESLSMDDVDYEPVRGPSSAEDSANSRAMEMFSDGSTDFNARVNRNREKENNDPEDLENVKKLLDRIQHQRKLIDEGQRAGISQDQSTHFKTIEGLAQGEAHKNVNRDFVNKVLDFESNSILLNPTTKQMVNCWTDDENSSITTTTSRGTKEKIKKVRKKKKQPDLESTQFKINEIQNKVKQAENPPNSKQIALRGYIEKLLSMRHEDVDNLSVSSLSSNRDASGSTLISSLKSTPCTNSISSDSSSKKQVRFQFDTVQDDSSYLGLPIQHPKTKSDDSSYLSLPVRRKKYANLNETATSTDTLYKELCINIGAHSVNNDIINLKLQHENVSKRTNSRVITEDGINKATKPLIHAEIQPQASDIRRQNHVQPQTLEENCLKIQPQSHAEIQALFRQKRQQLTDQLKKLQLEGYSDMETFSEGPLTSSSSGSTSIDLVSSIVGRVRMSEMLLTDVSSIPTGSASETEIVERDNMLTVITSKTDRNWERNIDLGNERSEELREVSLRSRKQANRDLRQELSGIKFSFNLSDDPGESDDESSKSKVSHIDLSTDEES